MDSTRIAVASSDGIVINNHFGHAKMFYIYQVDDEKPVFLEKRDVVPVCECGNHDELRLKENLELLADCEYLLVSRIGDKARLTASDMGINAYEIPGIIEESIDQLIKYINIQKLFE